ncbi:MAG: GNAT family N-acetyltransferase [Pseudomonadota bacterium]
MTEDPDMPVIETERLTLRPFAARDVARGTEYLTSDRSVYMGGPYSRHDAWQHACHLIGHWAVRGFGLFAICLKGQDDAIGDVGPFRPEGWPENEIGWGLWQSDFEGKGYVTEAARAARQYAFEVLNWDTAVSYIDPENTRSVAVAQRLDCTLDADAALPNLPDWDGTLVYRHPAPVEGKR